MFVSKAFAAVFAAVGLLVQPATAHSTERNPLSYISRVDDAVIHTPSHRVHSQSTFDLSFYLHDRQQKIRFVLEPNHDILPDDATIHILSPDGKVKRIEPIVREEHKVFRGTTFVQREGMTDADWRQAGWARVYVLKDGERPIFQGSFRVNGVDHHIQTDTNYRQTIIKGDPEIETADEEYMVVWRDSDILKPTHDDLKKRDAASMGSCASNDLLWNRDENNGVLRWTEEVFEHQSRWTVSPRALFGRQMDGTQGGNGAGVNLLNSIGSTAGCPTSKKVALIGIATDCTYTEKFNSTESLRQNVIDMVNKASQLFESSFSISLGIRNLTISDKECPATPPDSAPFNMPCSSGATITDRLVKFSGWRGKSNDNNAYWTLLSTCNTGSAVGLAWLGQTHAQTAPPEKNECCPLSTTTCDANAQFIMNPSTDGRITSFSACSIGNDVVTITGQQCGNGIVEAGEECDCGGEEGCGDNPCCDPKTCKFTTNSICDPANEECCTDKCQLAGAETVCRASTGPCDPEEKCSGTSGSCPADKTADDGTSCGDSLTCASGQCTSRDLQCKTFMATEDTHNKTSSCSNDGCALACEGPMFPDDRCYTLPQYFLDGTPCEGGGKCSNGICEGAKLSNQILDWFKNNKNIAIPVGCVIAGLLLISFISCCCSCCRRARSTSRRAPQRMMAPPPDMGRHPVGWNWGGGRNGRHVPLPSQSGPPPPPYQGGPPQPPMGQPMGQYEPFREQQRGYARYA
ncbi:Metallo-peptidase family M12-domain-containing protein [Neurospora tetraspora]|uniref:Disintegrin and metalloproteinase domain-containing protein B n=1 Tax=Neurospora tetraspora TaxID=94610 RepID=A0AAE0JEQ8_9PEZI|nr:Metallo-peptidase family M12-domain-containing protein [Neurospora tetraspora]